MVAAPPVQRPRISDRAERVSDRGRSLREHAAFLLALVGGVSAIAVQSVFSHAVSAAAIFAGSLLYVMGTPWASRFRARHRRWGAVTATALFLIACVAVALPAWRTERAIATEGRLEQPRVYGEPARRAPIVQFGVTDVPRYWLDDMDRVPEYFGHRVIVASGDVHPPKDLLVVPGSMRFLARRTPDGLPLFYDAPLDFWSTARGIELSTVVRDRSGNTVVEIDHNAWRVFPPYCSDKNFTKSALEVLDSRGHVVLQVVMLSDRVLLQGEWHNDAGRGVMVINPQHRPEFHKPRDPQRSSGGWAAGDVEPDEASIFPLPNPGYAEKKILPMFRYPSERHWGETVAAVPDPQETP